MEASDLVCARVRGLYRCTLPSGKHHDIALVNMFSRSAWRPRTSWIGCDVREESKDFDFVAVQYLVRGAHLINVFDAPKHQKERFYFNDIIYADMFLRAGN